MNVINGRVGLWFSMPLVLQTPIFFLLYFIYLFINEKVPNGKFLSKNQDVVLRKKSKVDKAYFLVNHTDMVFSTGIEVTVFVNIRDQPFRI